MTQLVVNVILGRTGGTSSREALLIAAALCLVLILFWWRVWIGIGRPGHFLWFCVWPWPALMRNKKTREAKMRADRQAAQPAATTVPGAARWPDCTRLVLAVDRAHAAQARRRGDELMRSISGRVIGDAAGLTLGSIPVLAAEHEPAGPARVTGATAVKVRVQEEPLALPCASCGRPGSFEQRFCGGCGTRMPVQDLAQPPALETTPLPTQPEATASAPAPTAAPPSASAPAPTRRSTRTESAAPRGKGGALGTMLFGLIVGGGMVYGGLKGVLVTKGTDTSMPVIVLGGLLALGGLISGIKRITQGREDA